MVAVENDCLRMSCRYVWVYTWDNSVIHTGRYLGDTGVHFRMFTPIRGPTRNCHVSLLKGKKYILCYGFCISDCSHFSPSPATFTATYDNETGLKWFISSRVFHLYKFSHLWFIVHDESKFTNSGELQDFKFRFIKYDEPYVRKLIWIESPWRDEEFETSFDADGVYKFTFEVEKAAGLERQNP